tara:strand:+ start:939 stop:2423 length:1485 start_codon:yes stop_codon:yes gene_type:complete
MFRAVHDGSIKAIWIMATNPAVSMPDAGFVREALEKCDFVVVSDVMANTDTTAFADVKFPALAWGEKDGTVTNSERVISRQRPIFEAPGEAKADWRIIQQVARRMGHRAAFNSAGPVDIFREYAAQTGFRNGGKRALDLSQWSAISDREYDDWKPWQWGGRSPFANGTYSTADQRAQLVAVEIPQPKNIDPDYPLQLNSGRYRDQWHTMTRTGLSPRLSQHRREPLLEIHPVDAVSLGVIDGGLARVRTAQGTSIFRVAVFDAQRKGQIFAPMHWTDQHGNAGRLNLLPDQSADPVSGQPAFKNSAADVEAILPEWRAFLVSRARAILPPILYWTSARIAGGWLTELAGTGAVDVEAMLPEGERLEAVDLKQGMRRIAVRDDIGEIAAALFLTRSGVLPKRDWIASQLVSQDQSDASAILAARPTVAGPDKGPIVCVCFNVGSNQICSAISEHCLTSVEDVGGALNAGTNCGSCRSEIAGLLAATKRPEPEVAE